MFKGYKFNDYLMIENDGAPTLNYDMMMKIYLNTDP
jgi:hypothetical protein